MKHLLAMKTTKCILPILIGIFVMSGALINLPLLKNDYPTSDAGDVLSDGNTVITASSLAKTTFVLSPIPLSFDASMSFDHQPASGHRGPLSVLSKDIFRNLVYARAP